MHVVKFNPVSELAEHLVPPPRPAKEYLPDWYKNTKAFYGNRPQFNEVGKANATVKMCVPFKDAMSSGYIQESWQDIYIERASEDHANYAFPTDPAIVRMRERLSIPIDKSFYQDEFVFVPQWVPELPKGWSMLFVSPVNHFELPFWLPSGIVDSDNFTQFSSESSIPFFIKKDFYGIIPAGTPLFQMIPIKRSRWAGINNKWNKVKQMKTRKQIARHIWGGYKKEYWEKKEYE